MMNDKIKQFIKDNLNLIEEDTKESWEKFYEIANSSPYVGWNFEINHTGLLTQTLLKAGITPLEKLNEVPMGFLRGSNIKSFIIPDNVISINYHAFKNCQELNSIYISNNLKKIHMGAFCNCTSLKQLYLPDSLTYIEEEAFSSCTFKIIWGSNPQIKDISGAVKEYDGLELEVPKSVTNLSNIPPNLEKLTLYQNTTFNADSLINYHNSLKEFNYIGPMAKCLKYIKNNKRYIKNNTQLKEIKCSDGIINL